MRAIVRILIVISLLSAVLASPAVAFASDERVEGATTLDGTVECVSEGNVTVYVTRSGDDSLMYGTIMFEPEGGGSYQQGFELGSGQNAISVTLNQAVNLENQTLTVMWFSQGEQFQKTISAGCDTRVDLEPEPEPIPAPLPDVDPVELGMGTGCPPDGSGFLRVFRHEGTSQDAVDVVILNESNAVVFSYSLAEGEDNVRVEGLVNGMYQLEYSSGGHDFTLNLPVQCEPPPPPPPPEPDGKCELSISKAADTKLVSVGDEITFRVEFKNVGDEECTGGGVKGEDTLSSNVEFVSMSTSGNVSEGYESDGYTKSDHTVRWNADVLEPGESGWVIIVVKVLEPYVCGDFTVTNTARITAYELDDFKTWATSNPVSVVVDNDCPPPPPPLPEPVLMGLGAGCINPEGMGVITAMHTGGEGGKAYRIVEFNTGVVIEDGGVLGEGETRSYTVLAGHYQLMWDDSSVEVLLGMLCEEPPPPPIIGSELTTITLVKIVQNDDGGEASVEDFRLAIDGFNAVSGEAYEVTPGTYALSELQLDGYTLVSVEGAEWDGESLTVTVSVDDGENIVITFTNNDNAPPPPEPEPTPPPLPELPNTGPKLMIGGLEVDIVYHLLPFAIALIAIGALILNMERIVLGTRKLSEQVVRMMVRARTITVRRPTPPMESLALAWKCPINSSDAYVSDIALRALSDKLIWSRWSLPPPRC